MGACDFIETAEGRSAREAFNKAVEEAQYEHGHGGYTGTIAEKDSFRPYRKRPSAATVAEAIKIAQDAVYGDEGDDMDKWGPAEMIHVQDTSWYVFFGYSSS